MTSAIPVQRSTNLANKPTGSWSLSAVQIYDFHIFLTICQKMFWSFDVSQIRKKSFSIVLFLNYLNLAECMWNQDNG